MTWGTCLYWGLQVELAKSRLVSSNQKLQEFGESFRVSYVRGAQEEGQPKGI